MELLPMKLNISSQMPLHNLPDNSKNYQDVKDQFEWFRTLKSSKQKSMFSLLCFIFEIYFFQTGGPTPGKQRSSLSYWEEFAHD